MVLPLKDLRPLYRTKQEGDDLSKAEKAVEEQKSSLPLSPYET
jgi:hypothetical protein